jgi:hypothetical protein
MPDYKYYRKCGDPKYRYGYQMKGIDFICCVYEARQIIHTIDKKYPEA